MSLLLFNDLMLPSMLERSLDRSLDRAFGGALTSAPRPVLRNMHAFDVVETKDKYELVADAPGMTPEEVTVELHEGVLTVSGQHSHEKKEEEEAVPAGEGGAGEGTGRKVLRSERTSYQFSRTFVLPENADPDAISAGLDQGVLKVSINKRPEPPKPQPKRISVNAHTAPSA